MYIPYPARPVDRVRFRTIAGIFEAVVGPTGYRLLEVELIQPARRGSPALSAYLKGRSLIPQLISNFRIIPRPRST
jgi:hypothetical protein